MSGSLDLAEARAREGPVLKVFIAGRESICAEIAEHACLKFSGRVGRTASAKALDDRSVRLAVQAYVRHRETGYDSLLMRGHERRDARDAVRDEVERIIEGWCG